MRAKVANRPELVTSELGGRKLVRVWKLCCQRWGMRSGGELGEALGTGQEIFNS